MLKQFDYAALGYGGGFGGQPNDGNFSGDGSGVGFRFEEEGMEFSALSYTPHELESAAHSHESPPIHHTVVRAALMRMGLGGDDSWGARPAAEYLPPAKPLTFRFTLRAVGGEEPERG